MLPFVPKHRLLRLNGDDLVIYDDDDSALVHIPLRGIAFRCSVSEAADIEQLCNGHGVHSASSDLLKSLQKLNDEGASSYPEIETITEAVPTEATLVLTETCNLGCSYCYASATPSKSAAMTFAIAKAAIDTIITNAKKSESKLARVRYIGGGEPTVVWKLLTDIQTYFLAQCLEYDLLAWSRLVTNGTLLNEERVEWIAENISFVTLSFDVLPELQQGRSFADGRSTHGSLMQTVQLLQAATVDFHVRVTVGVEAASRLVEIVHFLLAHTRVKHVRLEPVAEIGRAISMRVAAPADEIFLGQFLEARRLGRESGLNVTCKLFNNSSRIAARFCEAEFSVAPDGALSACHRYSKQDTPGFDLFRYGTLTEEGSVQVDFEKLNRVRKISANSFSDCTKCPARWNCASGCLSARVRDGQVQQHGPLCPLTRHLLKEAIREAVDVT